MSVVDRLLILNIAVTPGTEDICYATAPVANPMVVSQEETSEAP